MKFLSPEVALYHHKYIIRPCIIVIIIIIIIIIDIIIIIIIIIINVLTANSSQLE